MQNRRRLLRRGLLESARVPRRKNQIGGIALKRKKGIWLLLLLVCLTGVLISVVHIADYWQQTNAVERLNDTLVEQAVAPAPQPTEEKTNIPTLPQTEQETVQASPQETAPITVDFDVLQQENEDIIAWLYCPDTQINYPVVQGEDNEYYLRRLIDGTWNAAGSLFADYRNAGDFSDLHTVIYGHNMQNSSMFGTLPEYCSQAYYDAHPVMYLLTPEQNYKIALVAGYVTSPDAAIYGFEKTAEERDRLLSEALASSAFQTDVTVAEQDRLVTLSTCSYAYEDARFVLMGVLVPIG